MTFKKHRYKHTFPNTCFNFSCSLLFLTDPSCLQLVSMVPTFWPRKPHQSSPRPPRCPSTPPPYIPPRSIIFLQPPQPFLHSSLSFLQPFSAPPHYLPSLTGNPSSVISNKFGFKWGREVGGQSLNNSIYSLFNPPPPPSPPLLLHSNYPSFN